MAIGTSLSVRELQSIALKARADSRTVAKVLRGEQLPRDPHKQAAIMRAAKKLFPNFDVPKEHEIVADANGGAQ